MQRKRSYYLKTFTATVIGAAAGLVLGLQIETTHAITRSNDGAFVAAQAGATSTFVPFTATSSVLTCAGDCADLARECAQGVEDECIYL